MTTHFKTEQEGFWVGKFGDEFVERHKGAALVASNLALLGRVLERTAGMDVAIEFCAKTGTNLAVLRQRVPGTVLNDGCLFKRDFASEMLAGFPIYAWLIPAFSTAVTAISPNTTRSASCLQKSRLLEPVTVPKRRRDCLFYRPRAQTLMAP